VTVVNKDMILTEEEEDLADILSPINDQLVLAKSWWFLELLPLKLRYQRKDGTWGSRMRSNLAEGRCIPRGDHYKIKVHRTVKLRMEAGEDILPEGRRYDPRAKPWEHHRVEWVD